MQTIILCGGQGTRLREETEYRPKPLVPVGGKPILWHIMKMYAHYGYRDFVLALGYRGDMIKEYFLNYEAMNNDFSVELGQRSTITYFQQHTEQGIKVTLADTGEDSMTGGRISRAARYVNEDTMMVAYGDGLANVDLAALLAFHRSHGKLVTVTGVRPQSRYGVLEIASDARVERFAEKPQADGFVSAGFFVIERKALDLIDGDECIWEREPLEKLASAGQLMVFRHDGFFFAMDTYREYLHLNELWVAGNAPWKVWT